VACRHRWRPDDVVTGADYDDELAVTRLDRLKAAIVVEAQELATLPA
jgi:hypothetical protein